MNRLGCHPALFSPRGKDRQAGNTPGWRVGRALGGWAILAVAVFWAGVKPAEATITHPRPRASWRQFEQISLAIWKAQRPTRCEIAAADHNQDATTGKNNCREPAKVVDVDQLDKKRKKKVSNCSPLRRLSGRFCETSRSETTAESSTRQS